MGKSMENKKEAGVYIVVSGDLGLPKSFGKSL